MKKLAQFVARTRVLVPLTMNNLLQPVLLPSLRTINGIALPPWTQLLYTLAMISSSGYTAGRPGGSSG